MAYVANNKITVLPAARKPEAESRLTSENSFSNIVKILSPGNVGSFIITSDTAASEIEFCIEGYYVKVLKSDLTNAVGSSTIYVTADYVDSTADVKELKGPQNTSESSYLGLVFSTTGSANALQILNSGSIPEAYMYKTLWKNQILSSYKTFFVSNGLPQYPTDEQKSQICIDSSNGYSAAVYANNSWVRLGAVAK